MYLLFLLIISFSFSQLGQIYKNQDEIIEIGIGHNRPTGVYDKYAEPGFSARFSYSKAFNNNGLFKWQVGAQYILFENNFYNDNFEMSSGFSGPSVDVNNSEQSYIFNTGVRLTATNGILNRRNFKPYIAASVGLAFFSETTTWSWDDGYNSNNDCNTDDFWIWMVGAVFDLCDDNDSMHDVLHRSTEPIFTLDIGTNLFFSQDHNIGLDAGIRYNMVTGLKRPNDLYELSNSESGALEQGHANIAEKLQADYYTWYIGVSFKLDSKERSLRKEERRRKKQGKLI